MQGGNMVTQDGCEVRMPIWGGCKVRMTTQGAKWSHEVDTRWMVGENVHATWEIFMQGEHEVRIAM